MDDILISLHSLIFELRHIFKEFISYGYVCVLHDT